MKVLSIIFCCVIVAQANVLKTRDHSLWEEFKKNHNKVYRSETEHEFRFKIFLDNLRTIHQHNKEYEAGKTTFLMGVNQFADLLSSEFAETMLGRVKDVRGAEEPREALPQAVNLPSSVDWRSEGAVTPVKDQGQCGGCWSFAATGGLEGQHFLKTGKMVSLSEQQLIDCSTANAGCGGGLEYDGWAYVKKNGGIDTEDSYPYEARNGRCRFDSSSVGATCTGFKKLPQGDESALQNAVATVGPIAIGIDAEASFQFYRSGVLKANDCSRTRLNHSVLAVGYGTENGQDYWLVKNSWGSSFGENGYIKMARNYNNMCGVSSDASYPTV